MAKNFAQNAEDRSMFLVPAATATDKARKGERADTSPFRAARVIDINRIKPDPEQPRKTFVQESLKSLAESIKELGGIIDPLTVEYMEKDDLFQIISGERRYRAAKMAGPHPVKTRSSDCKWANQVPAMPSSLRRYESRSPSSPFNK